MLGCVSLGFLVLQKVILEMVSVEMDIPALLQFCASALGAQGWEMDCREVLLSQEVHFFL